MPDTYHHGDLSSTLRAATAELVAERGARGFSLREVARRAGVSHAAPAHHFGDSRGLLTAVAVEGYHALADSLTEAAADNTDVRERLRASGRAYVATAMANPGHYAVMIDSSIHDPDDPGLTAEGLRAFAQLIAVVEAIRDDCNPDLDVEAAATTCWATMHGLVVLDPKIARIAEKLGRPPVDIVDHVDSAVDLLFNGFTHRPPTPDLEDG